jgi:hypothetical protein
LPTPSTNLQMNDGLVSADDTCDHGRFLPKR